MIRGSCGGDGFLKQGNIPLTIVTWYTLFAQICFHNFIVVEYCSHLGCSLVVGCVSGRDYTGGPRNGAGNHLIHR